MAEKPEDLNLPNAVIGRILKETLPEGAIVSKEARSAISKAASIFVLYSTSWANNFALQQKRKTLKDTDVMAAVEEMEFDTFLPGLKTSLDAFKKERKETADKKKKIKEAATKEPDQKISNESEEKIYNEPDEKISDESEGKITDESEGKITDESEEKISDENMETNNSTIEEDEISEE